MESALTVAIRFVVLVVAVALILFYVLFVMEDPQLHPSRQAMKASFRPTFMPTSQYPSVAPSLAPSPEPMVAPSTIKLSMHLNEDALAFNQSVILFSALNDHYEEQYRDYIYKNSKYSQRHRYQYFIIKNRSGSDMEMSSPHYNRIYSALDLIQGKLDHGEQRVDWIAYIDADAFIAEPSLPLQLIIKLATDYARPFRANNTKAGEECHFIAQDTPHIVNSGFWMIRNSTWSINFLRSWIEDCNKEKRDHFHWSSDQGPLMNTILHYAYRAVARGNDGNISHTYNDECRRHIPRDIHWANICWKSHLSRLGFPFEQRIIGPICLLGPSHGVPWRLHIHNDYHPGDFIRHQKGLSRDQVENHPTFVSFDRIALTVNLTGVP